MEKQYPQLYKQGDFPQRLGTDKSMVTIAQSGCFVTSFAMKATFYGHPINPVQLNDLLVQAQVFQDANLLPDNALAQIYKDIFYIKTLDYEPIPTDLENIRQLLTAPTVTVTIRINLGHGNLHFVEAVACDGHTLHIANPLSGHVEDFSQFYGDPVKANLHVLVYNGPAIQAPQPTAQPQPESTGVAQRFNQAIAKSGNFDTVCQYFGISNDQAIQPGTGAQLVIDRIKQLQEQVEQLQKAPATVVSVPANQQVSVTTTAVPAVPSNDTANGNTPPVNGNPMTTTPVFKDGTTAIGSSAATAVPTPSAGTKPTTIASGAVSPIEFLRAIFTLLFK